MDEIAKALALIEDAAQALQRGELVAFPTETVYGLGGNALDEKAVAEIFRVKGRPSFDPLIVHLFDPVDITELVTDFPPRAQELAARFWPGPMTMVLPKKDHVPDLVTAGLPSVAVRVPDHPVALTLLRRAGVPVAAPSANRFGAVSPTTAQHVRDGLGDAVAHVLDGGPCRTGVESTVLAVPAEDDTPVTLLRPGGLAREQIEEITGPLGLPTPEEKPGHAQAAPGMLKKHYATRTPLHLADDEVHAHRLVDQFAGQHIALLALKAPEEPGSLVAMELLSEQGDLGEAAANLFAAMRRLDREGIDRIIAIRVPDQGLGLAINDRLTRAAAGSAE